MEITLKKASFEDTNLLHQMQMQSFKPLLGKYQGCSFSPAKENVEEIGEILKRDDMDYYIIKYGHVSIGGIRVTKTEEHCCKMNSIFILPEYQGKGIGQKVIKLVENQYGKDTEWFLEAIKQEKNNCYIYEKLGYVPTGQEEKINEDFTLVQYNKHHNFK